MTKSLIVPQEDPAKLRAKLKESAKDLMDRGLNSSAKWLTELLRSIPKTTTTTTNNNNNNITSPLFRTSTPNKGENCSIHHQAGRSAGVGAINSRQSLPGLSLGSIEHFSHRDSLSSVIELEGGSSPIATTSAVRMEDKSDEDNESNELGRIRDEEEEDVYMLGLAYFRTHEYLRAAHALRECNGPKSRWLRCYSMYLVGEKRVQEESGDLLGLKDKGARNPHAQELLTEMESWEEGAVENDGYLLFLKALLLQCRPPTQPPSIASKASQPSKTAMEQLDIRLVALDILVSSVKLSPYNWSAWLKLASCIDGPEELEATLAHIPLVPTALFFFVHATLEIHAAEAGLHDTLDELEGIFPGCATIKGMRGLIHYHVREFEDATQHFSELRISDPYRVEDIDIYSNILYVSEKRAELATLAQEFIKMDRARAEVCCLVGNYYSLRREHEKAIQYFRRALRLDRGYLSAWTLMGHEYVEIKNTNAAIASYRRAVDVNRKDYRAWYGLGQTYELLGEPFYALNYYQKATALRPYDARMWAALAVCYEKLKRIPDAIKSYQRALVSSEPGENDTALRIGRLYALQGNTQKAADYHRRALAEGLKTGQNKNELGGIYLWLAKWEVGREKEKSVLEGKKEKMEEDGEDEEEDDIGGDLVVAQMYAKEMLTVQEYKEEAKLLLNDIEKMLLNRD